LLGVLRREFVGLEEEEEDALSCFVLKRAL
jgi:hypothetical protein